MNQKGLMPILIVIILAATLGGGYLVYQRVQNKFTPKIAIPLPIPTPISSLTSTPTPTSNSNISTSSSSNTIPIKREQYGNCTKEVLYETNLKVKNEADTQKAFQKYIDYMKANKLKDMNLAVDWEFEKAEYAGDKKPDYWLVIFRYVMESSSEKGRSQTYVSGDGEIVNFICLPPGGDTFFPQREL